MAEIALQTEGRFCCAEANSDQGIMPRIVQSHRS